MELFSESTNDPSLEMEATGAVPYLKELFKDIPCSFSAILCMEDLTSSTFKPSWFDVVVASEALEDGSRGLNRAPNITFNNTIAPMIRKHQFQSKCSTNLNACKFNRKLVFAVRWYSLIWWYWKHLTFWLQLRNITYAVVTGAMMNVPNPAMNNRKNYIFLCVKKGDMI